MYSESLFDITTGAPGIPIYSSSMRQALTCQKLALNHHIIRIESAPFRLIQELLNQCS